MSEPTRVGPRHRWRVRMLAAVVRRELSRAVGDGKQSDGKQGDGKQSDRTEGDGRLSGGTEGGRWRVGGGFQGARRQRRRELVLDAGCGDGSLALELAHAGCHVVAVDRSRARLRRAVRRARRAGAEHAVAFACADVRALPLRDGEYEVAAAGEVLEHVTDDGLAARELARVLAPGGSAAITVPAGPDRFGPADRRAGHVRRYDRSSLVRLLAGAGLEVVLVDGWGFPFGRLYDRWVQRPALAAGGGTAGRLVAALGRSAMAWWVWSTLFGVDEMVSAGERGSGWLAVARCPRSDDELRGEPEVGRDSRLAT